MADFYLKSAIILGQVADDAEEESRDVGEPSMDGERENEQTSTYHCAFYP